MAHPPPGLHEHLDKRLHRQDARARLRAFVRVPGDDQRPVTRAEFVDLLVALGLREPNLEN